MMQQTMLRVKSPAKSLDVRNLSVFALFSCDFLGLNRPPDSTSDSNWGSELDETQQPLGFGETSNCQSCFSSRWKAACELGGK